MVMYQNKGIGRLSQNGAKDFTRMSQRLVDSSSADFNGRDMTIAGIEKDSGY